MLLDNVKRSYEHVTCRFVDLFPPYFHELEIINSLNRLSEMVVVCSDKDN